MKRAPSWVKMACVGRERQAAADEAEPSREAPQDVVDQWLREGEEAEGEKEDVAEAEGPSVPKTTKRRLAIL